MAAGFEWDEAKRLANIVKHDIDFERAKEIWQGRFLEVPSPQEARRGTVSGPWRDGRRGHRRGLHVARGPATADQRPESEGL
jgi:uncharacterized DUF497 family protein